MATLNIDLDFEPLLRAHADQVEALQKDLQAGAQALAASTHAHVMEKAAERLHSRLDAYRKACHLEQVADNIWAITVDGEALWIEDGQAAHSMLPDLLGSPKAKTAADGGKYIVIPFDHGKAPTRQTADQRSITGMLRAELQARKIPWKGIEKHGDGTPKTGLLHKFDLGGPQRGPTAHNVGWTSPALNGVRIYQNIVRGENGQPRVQRDILTFRVASSKHAGLKWNHPGQDGVRLLDEALTWAQDHWEKEVLPSILAKYE